MKTVCILLIVSILEIHSAEYVEYYFRGDWGASTKIVINEDSTYVCKTINGRDNTENVTQQGKLSDGSYAALMGILKDNGLLNLETGGLIKAVQEYQVANNKIHVVYDAGTPILTYFVDGNKREQKYPGALSLKIEFGPVKEFAGFIKTIDYIVTIVKG